MCEVCFKEFKGWCKSFTKTEIYLSLLEVIFLIVFITFLIFLVLHCLACLRHQQENEDVTTPGRLTTITMSPTIDNSSVSTATSKKNDKDKVIECTWTSSKKTVAGSHYYERNQAVTVASPKVKDRFGFKHEKSLTQNFKSDITNSLVDIHSDVEIVDNARKNFLLALVKIRHSRDILFGCTLTVVSSQWTLSAASCLEAIEEVDALDSFVMMESFGEESQGETHELSAVIVHPEYQGINKSYDLVALKSDDVLVKDYSSIITLPTLLDNSLITLGERLGVLGFGKFSTEEDPLDRRVREVSVYKMVRSRCLGEDTWAARHLTEGIAVSRGSAADSPGICAGRAGAGAGTDVGAGCPCGGAPLLRERTLLGIMSDDGACGLSCRPALYVDLALRRDWLDSVLQSD